MVFARLRLTARNLRSLRETCHKVRDREAVMREAGGPAARAEAGELLHHVDLVAAARIAHALDRPHEHALRALLRGLAAEEDPHRRAGPAGRAGGRREPEGPGGGAPRPPP